MLPTPTKAYPGESKDNYKKRMEETDDLWIYHTYFPYSLYEERNLPALENNPRAPQFSMSYLLNQNIGRPYRLRPVVFLGFNDIKTWASVFEYHMPEITYVNTRFHNLQQLIEFATDYMHILEPIACIIVISQSLYIALLVDAGYHCSSDTLDLRSFEQLAQYLTFHNHMMTHRNTKRKTTWTVHLVFPDAPHLRKLTEYHQYLNLLLPQQEPNYR